MVTNEAGKEAIRKEMFACAAEIVTYSFIQMRKKLDIPDTEKILETLFGGLMKDNVHEKVKQFNDLLANIVDIKKGETNGND